MSHRRLGIYSPHTNACILLMWKFPIHQIPFSVYLYHCLHSMHLFNTRQSLHTHYKESWAPIQYKDNILARIGNPIVVIRQSYDRLISTMGFPILVIWRLYIESGPRAPSQYPIRRLFVRSRKVSKPRDLYLELSDRSEIWQALRQHCCRCACQISKRYDNLKYQSRGFETSRYLTKRRLFGYWDGAQNVIWSGNSCSTGCGESAMQMNWKLNCHMLKINIYLCQMINKSLSHGSTELTIMAQHWF